MYSKLSVWLSRLASRVTITAKDIRTNSIRARWQKCLLNLSDVCDGISKTYLKIRALALWRLDQIGSRFTKNEFDSSLDMNSEVLFHLSKKQSQRYRADLIKRRLDAHRRDLDREDKLRGDPFFESIETR